MKIKDLNKRGEVVCVARSSDGERVYEVRKEAKSLTCECKGFQFRRSCRHIKEYLERMVAMDEALKEEMNAILSGWFKGLGDLEEDKNIAIAVDELYQVFKKYSELSSGAKK